MPNTFQEVIDRAQTCEVTFVRRSSVCKPAVYYQLAYAAIQASILLPYQPMYPMNQLVALAITICL
ncbi:15727_t:CDS:1, partial [Cetraspora pellucida]